MSKKTCHLREKNRRIFVINLDRSPDRLKAVGDELGKLGIDFERISAVDGRSLKKADIDAHYSENLNRQRYFTPLNRNEIACYMSHLLACRKIISENLDYGIILEDDVRLSPNFPLVLDAIDSIELSWKIIKISAIGKKKKVVWRRAIGKFQDKNAESYQAELVLWNKPPIGAQAYAVSREGAKMLLELRDVFYRPYDVDFQYPWEMKTNIYGILPFAVSVADLTSDIGHVKQNQHHPLSRIMYKFKYLLSKLINCNKYR